MRILLINVVGRLSSDGSRLISALLKRAGHQVKTVFLARPEPLDYDIRELEALDPLLQECDLVLIGVYSSYAIRAVQVTGYVRRRSPGVKILWGGPHCISIPELGLRHADGVCFAEGDEAVVECVNKMEAREDYWTTPNMAFNHNGSPGKNRVLPPFSDLDSLPYYDYDLESQYLLDHDLYPMTKALHKERLADYPFYIPILYFLTSRGCPHRCSYCNNCRYLALFGRNPIRFHSVDRIIEELEHILKRLDFFQFVGFGDDDFFMRPKRDLEEFAVKYKKRIGIPFGVAVSANTFHRDKMEILLSAGLKAVQMGVQSGSDRVLREVYHRKIRTSKTREVVHAIAKVQKTHRIHFFLDFIIDNPYETRDDVMDTYRYLLEVPETVRINIFFLAFFPGTPLYERALEDGIIGPFSEKAFRFYTRSSLRYQKNYETLLVLLFRYLRRDRQKLYHLLPPALLRFLGSRPLRGLSSLFPPSFYSFLSKTVQ